MRFLQLLATGALVGCAPLVDVTDAHLAGELGDVSDPGRAALVDVFPGEGGRSMVELGVDGPDGEQLMLIVDLPADFARRARANETFAAGSLAGEEPARLKVATIGCSRVDPEGEWDVDRPAAGSIARVELTDDPAIRRVHVVAEFVVEERTQSLEGASVSVVPMVMFSPPSPMAAMTNSSWGTLVPSAATYRGRIHRIELSIGNSNRSPNCTSDPELLSRVSSRDISSVWEMPDATSTGPGACDPVIS